MQNCKTIENIGKNRMSILGIATLMVYAAHRHKLIFAGVSVLSNLEKYFWSKCTCSVEIFFFISGIGMVKSYETHGNFLKFIYKRIKRITLQSLMNSVVIYKISKNMLDDFFGLIFWRDGPFSSSLWFYHAILTMYLIFPIYYQSTYKKIKNKKLLSISIVMLIYILSFIYRNKIENGLIEIFFCRIPPFVMGVYIGDCLNNRNMVISKKEITFYEMLFTVILVILNGSKILFFNIEEIACSFLIMCLASFLLEKTKGTFFNGILSVIGKYSFEIYIVQMLMDPSRFYNNMPTGIANIIMFICVFFISVVFKKVVDLFWNYIERFYRTTTEN